MPLSALGLLDSDSVSGEALTNPVIARCCEAWRNRFKVEKSNSKNKLLAVRYAGISYRNAMPPLLDYEGIRDFIACTAHGMLIGAIPHHDGTRLLYAAQVALSLHRQPQETRPPGRPKCLLNK
jgi:hypothetical protein